MMRLQLLFRTLLLPALGWGKGTGLEEDMRETEAPQVGFGLFPHH